MAFSIAINREYVFERNLGKEGGQLPHESLGRSILMHCARHVKGFLAGQRTTLGLLIQQIFEQVHDLQF
jgi:hypothetical protein